LPEAVIPVTAELEQRTSAIGQNPTLITKTVAKDAAESPTVSSRVISTQVEIVPLPVDRNE
jgi:hypothetical protein